MPITVATPATNWDTVSVNVPPPPRTLTSWISLVLPSPGVAVRTVAVDAPSIRVVGVTSAAASTGVSTTIAGPSNRLAPKLTLPTSLPLLRAPVRPPLFGSPLSAEIWSMSLPVTWVPPNVTV